MALVKKVHPEWQPMESPIDKPGQMAEVGDILQITDYRTLVRSGAAVLVDEQGNELGLPGETYRCPVCGKEIVELKGFITHANSHNYTGIAQQPQSVASDAVLTRAAEILALEQMAAEDDEQSITGADAVEDEQSYSSVLPPALPTTSSEHVAKTKRLAALAKAREVRAAKRR